MIERVEVNITNAEFLPLLSELFRFKFDGHSKEEALEKLDDDLIEASKQLPIKECQKRKAIVTSIIHKIYALDDRRTH